MAFCPSKENPAEMGSKGMVGSDVRNNRLWWYEPSWLSQQENNWPRNEVITDTPESDSEKIPSVNALMVEITEPCGINNVLNISRWPIYATNVGWQFLALSLYVRLFLVSAAGPSLRSVLN